MMRIAGVTIPDNKQLAYALPLIFGIGKTRARAILKTAGISAFKKGSELTSEEEQKVRSLAEQYIIEGELRREIGQNIKRLKDIRSLRGERHSKGLPVRGQRTKTNSRTRRGNVRKTMTSGRRTLEKT
ncbi:30S ribosomal protein S13 [Candidatus Kaiserbacteria bacterium RIFCSPLOWO2_02_FULL_55_12]|uniref:Small ribosomal subunit protein uS13 n=2 Tax=Candidatus Kaiseribacteriota TaxID=1752734 RepID=A0A1F6EYS9_9BACT|nr:MAG: 30S ribosomal protein S13 [Candidatus Kaiserbacteria bacterium RIFCSPHIGHO2_02_FULL_55_17]OGG78770.1 MAG: 30S ribosomal protein S13 [Candidatus Kaiserbacteria bacterium RIFCSPLOWO2_02_FULL_55_12]